MKWVFISLVVLLVFFLLIKRTTTDRKKTSSPENLSQKQSPDTKGLDRPPLDSTIEDAQDSAGDTKQSTEPDPIRTKGEKEHTCTPLEELMSNAETRANLSGAKPKKPDRGQDR